MSTKKSTWIIGLAAIACIGCCALPLFALVAGISVTGIGAALTSRKGLEVMMYLLPIALVLMGYVIYRRHQVKKACCSSPGALCSEAQCAVDKG